MAKRGEQRRPRISEKAIKGLAALVRYARAGEPADMLGWNPGPVGGRYVPADAETRERVKREWEEIEAGCAWVERMERYWSAERSR